MAIFLWIDGDVPNGIRITQVYGIIFTRDGRILLIKDGEKYSFAGGKPEKEDNGLSGTLRRELLEEANVTIGEPLMVGYQLVDEENGIAPYAQVRMTALIENIGDKKVDPATGLTFDRVLVPYYKGAEILRWGEVATRQIDAAFLIVKEKFGLDKINEEILFV